MHALALIVCVALPSLAMAADTDWAPVPVFEFTHSMTSPGQPMKTKVDASVGMSPFHETPFHMKMPPQGYAEALSDEEITVGGTAFPCVKRVWTLDQASGTANHRSRTFTAWTSDAHDSPVFTIPMQGGPDLPVPAGCLRYVAEPVREGDPGANTFDTENPVSAVLEWRGRQTHALGEARIEGHRYDLAITNGKRGALTGTMDVSTQVDGGIVALDADVTGRQAGHVTTALTRIGDAGVPDGLKAYDDNRFGFAPPLRLAEVAPREGEICRFAADPAFLAIASFDPAGQELDPWFRTLSEPLSQQKGYTIFGSGFQFRVLQCLSVGYWDQAADVGHRFFIHEGRGYHVSFGGAGDMPQDDVHALLAGWRWPAAGGSR